MSSSRTEATVVDVTMPQMGVSVAEGTVVEWRKQPGDWVQADETIAEVSTDKIDTDIPAPASGRLTEILVEAGTTVDVGVALARIATDATPGEPHAAESAPPEPPPASDAAAAVGTSPAPSTPAPAPEPDPGTAAAPVPRPPGARRYSPVVLRVAAEHGVDLEHVQGTGRGGRVRKQDVLAHVEQAASANGDEAPLHIESPYRPDPPAGAYQPPEARPLSRMRRSIGEHMKRSLETAATCTTWIEVDFTRLERVRRELGVTALPLVARCTIGALREFPALNSWLEGERHTVHEKVNLGIAVSLDSDGLIVPVIHDAQDLSAEGLSGRIRDLARRARSKQLTPDDVKGGTFTITNPGQYGTLMATPVINQPQVAILDVEAVVKRAVVVTGEDGSDAIAIRPLCVLGLSWDHRAMDGVLAARFLAELRRRIETLDA